LSSQISPLKGKDQNINHIGTNWLSYYPLIILFNLLGASSLISSFDLLFMYISIELQSFSLYILSTLNRDSVQSTSAGLRYFLIGGFASCLILLGIGLVYSSTGLTQFESLSILLTNIYNTEFYTSASLGLDTTINLSNYSFSTIGLGEGGLILILIGFLIKLGAAPLHQWAPDVYDKVPTKVTT
jgi:NADH-ubiquinone oxidoreductase chain 2